MASKNLGRYMGTVRKERSCLTAYAALLLTYDNIEVVVGTNSMKELERVWSRLSSTALDKSKVKRVAYFQEGTLSSKRRRYKKTSAEGKKE